MHVLAMVHAYLPHHNAGAETTLHALLRAMTDAGHRVDVLLSRDTSAVTEHYDLDDVRVYPHVDDADPMPWFFGPSRADVVITHLENTQRAAALCDIHRVPLVQVVHNTEEFTKGALARGPVQLALFNSQWMYDAYEEFWTRVQSRPMPPNVVIHPVVDPKLYATKHGQKVTLINLNEAKGGELFWALAKAMPKTKFLGVLGAYGSQVLPNEGRLLLPNTEIMTSVEHSEMAEHVYADTKILLMPSSYESYGRVAIEAACSGIPTIAHPTPGLLEALGDAGTFVDRDDLDGWVKAITYLQTPRGYGTASKKASALAKRQNPKADLTRFTDAMEGVVRRGFATVTG